MNGKSLSLAELLSAPVVGQSGPGRASKGVLLVFYRGLVFMPVEDVPPRMPVTMLSSFEDTHGITGRRNWRGI